MQNHLNSMMARATTFQKLDKAEQKRYARKHIMHHKNATKDRRTGFKSAKAYMKRQKRPRRNGKGSLKKNVQYEYHTRSNNTENVFPERIIQ